MQKTIKKEKQPHILRLSVVSHLWMKHYSLLSCSNQALAKKKMCVFNRRASVCVLAVTHYIVVNVCIIHFLASVNILSLKTPIKCLRSCLVNALTKLIYQAFGRLPICPGVSLFGQCLRAKDFLKRKVMFFLIK